MNFVRLRSLVRPALLTSHFPVRFASQTLDRKTGKILHGGAAKIYQSMVEKGELRLDQNQLALAQTLTTWGQNFIEKEKQILDFKDEYHRVVDLGQHAKRISRGGSPRADAGEKKERDPLDRSRQIIQSKYAALDSLKQVYVHGEPGCGKSFLCDLLYDSLDLGKRKARFHYTEFILQIHEREHQVNQKLKGRTGETIAIVGN